MVVRGIDVRPLAAALWVAWPMASSAVSLSSDGLGQALVFPYYTTRTAAGNSFNTYLSVVNTQFRAKAVKVRLREGRNARVVFETNVYLGSFDIWTAVLVPDGSGAKLVSRDASCTNPPMPVDGIAFSDAQFTGTNGDNGGTGLERVREGYVEAIEMGTLTGAAANAVAMVSGVPVNCAAVQGPVVTLRTIEAPTGGLAGTGTLINVHNGSDMTYVADALADLAAAPLYADPGQPGADFDSPEVSPVSVVVDSGRIYRSVWTRGRDAVSAVLMRSVVANEFVLDAATNSQTDWVVTLPTRRLYVTGSSFERPFTAPFASIDNCEFVGPNPLDREQRGIPARGCDFATRPNGCETRPRMCWAATVIPFRNESPHMVAPGTSGVLGSTNLFVHQYAAASAGLPYMPVPFANGWMTLQRDTSSTADSLVSGTASSMRDARTGVEVIGAHVFRGLPVVGLMVRTFQNNAVPCGAGTCQGNYGGAFPHRYSRSIGPP